MYDFIIKKYIPKLTANDILDYGNKNNIILTSNEANTILNYIKNDWKILIYGDESIIFNKIKCEISEENYIKIKRLYYNLKEKYIKK